MNNTGMKGIFTALLTPFYDDYSLNAQSLKDRIEFNIKSGVNGFYVCGSTGEAMLMSTAQRKEILRLVKEITGDRVKLIAHVGSMNTDDSVNMALYAGSLGYDAVSAVAPYYYSYPVSAIKEYYYEIARKSEMPLFIYNFPTGSGFGLTPEICAEMFGEEPLLAGVKHTSTDLFALNSFKREIPRITVFNGFDEICLAGLAMGADGAIGSTYNFMGSKFVALYDAFCAGDIEKAQKFQNEACEIISVLCKYGVFQCEKEILTLMGIDMGPCRKPILPLSDEGKAAMKEIVRSL